MDRRFQPAVPTHHYLASPAGRTHAVDLGGGPRPALVFLSGLGSCAAGYHHLLRELAGQRRVIGLDRFGSGLSDGLRVSGHPRSTWVEQVVAVVSRLGLGQVDLVGHSLGGMVAAAAAIDCPGLVRRLVLIAPLGVGRNHPWTWAPAMVPGATDIAAALAWRAVNPNSDADREGWDPCQLAAGRWWGAADLDSVGRLITPRGYRRATTLLPDLGLLHDRTLILWGDRDGQVPLAPARDALAAYPALRLEVLPGAGHLAPLERPVEVAAAVRRWLD